MICTICAGEFSTSESAKLNFEYFFFYFGRGIFTDPFQFFQYLGVLQGVWRGVVGGRGGERVLVAVPANDDGD